MFRPPLCLKNSLRLSTPVYDPLGIESGAHSWSDIVPADNALAFAVAWNPDDDVAFSDAEFKTTSTEEAITPTDVCEIPSQLSSMASSRLNVADMTFIQDAHSSLFHGQGSRIQLGRTHISSNLDGSDIYVRGSLMGKVHSQNLHFSCLDILDKDFSVEPFDYNQTKQTEEEQDTVLRDCPMTDSKETFESRPIQQSKDTTLPVSVPWSTKPDSSCSSMASAFVTIEREDASSLWSTFDHPPSFTFQQFFETNRRSSPRRLRKRRPENMAVPPLEVLQREYYNHDVALYTAIPLLPMPSHSRNHSSPVLPSQIFTPKLAKSLSRWKRCDTAN